MEATTMNQEDTLVESQAELSDDKLTLAEVIYELYEMGLLLQEIDAHGTPRWRPKRAAG